VDVEPLRDGGDLLADVAQHGDLDSGLAAARLVVLAAVLETGPAAVEPVRLVRPIALPGLLLLLEPLAPGGSHAVDLAGLDDALALELAGIDVERRRMLPDDLVHARLRERRLVALVVAVPAVAEHVDDDRLVEFLPELDRHLGGEGHRLGIVAVDVKDRRLDHLGDVGRIGRGSGEARIGGEADLVVDDEMQRAAGAMAAQARKAEAFGDDALAGEGRIAVDQQRQHLLALAVLQLVLLGAHLAEHDRVDDLEMRRVGRQRQVHLVAVELAVGRGAEVVLHVARALDLVGGPGAALELVEDRPVRLAEHLGEDVQPAAMRHAEDDLAHPERAAALDDLLERRDDRLAAVETEALGAGVFRVEEALEALGLDELVEDRPPALAGEGDLLLRSFDALLQPGLLARLGDVHELDAERRAVGAAQDGEHLADGRELQAEHVVDKDLAVEIGLAEAVGGRVELWMRLRRLEPQRIEIGLEMAAHAVGADHHQRADGVARRLLHLLGRDVVAVLLRLGKEALADRRLEGAERAVEGGDGVAVGARRPVRPLPGRALGVAGDIARRVGEPAEELPPLDIDLVRALDVAGVEIVEVAGVAAVKERGLSEGLVRRLA
jgi:hypothetical protein